MQAYCRVLSRWRALWLEDLKGLVRGWTAASKHLQRAEEKGGGKREIWDVPGC